MLTEKEYTKCIEDNYIKRYGKSMASFQAITGDSTRRYTKEEKDIMMNMGEYCGVCGKIANTEKEYQAMRKMCWYCSEKCEKEGEKMDESR